MNSSEGVETKKLATLPWRYNAMSCMIEDVDGNDIAQIRTFGLFSQRDNHGRLMAAAPKLLDACKGALQLLEDMDHDDIVCAIDLRAAIAEVGASVTSSPEQEEGGTN